METNRIYTIADLEREFEGVEKTNSQIVSDVKFATVEVKVRNKFKNQNISLLDKIKNVLGFDMGNNQTGCALMPNNNICNIDIHYDGRIFISVLEDTRNTKKITNTTFLFHAFSISIKYTPTIKLIPI